MTAFSCSAVRRPRTARPGAEVAGGSSNAVVPLVCTEAQPGHVRPLGLAGWRGLQREHEPESFLQLLLELVEVLLRLLGAEDEYHLRVEHRDRGPVRQSLLALVG